MAVQMYSIIFFRAKNYVILVTKYAGEFVTVSFNETLPANGGFLCLSGKAAVAGFDTRSVTYSGVIL